MKRQGPLVAAVSLVFFMCFVAAPAARGAPDGVRVRYLPFTSTLYRYTLMQPDSFRHIVLRDPVGRQVDYFYPALGSSVTDVNIYAERHNHLDDQAAILRVTGAVRVRVSGHLAVGHMKIAIVSGDRSGIPGKWREEGAEFIENGQVWHMTMSYLFKYASLRPMMLHMLETFRPQ